MAYAVNPNICQGCGVCAKTCPTGAIKVEDGKAIIDQTLCNQCGACVTVCPYGAIGADSVAFKEAWRVLKPGGHVVIGFVDRESPLGQKYETARSENVFYREATFYSVPEVLAHLEGNGFGEFAFAQTIFRDLSEIQRPEPVKEGYGEGSFVVIRAKKISC